VRFYQSLADGKAQAGPLLGVSCSDNLMKRLKDARAMIRGNAHPSILDIDLNLGV
jgi:hypothetical protein